MKLINQKSEYWSQKDLYKQIERCARVCYKSEDKITEDSAKKMVDRLIQSKHLAMLEHGTVYLELESSLQEPPNNIYEISHKYENNQYSKVVKNVDDGDIVHRYITTNLRVLVENHWEEDLEYLCMPNYDFHARRVTVHFVTNRQVANELVRHRTMSFAQESTRYCNYMNDKFGSELTFIEPCWMYKDAKQPLLIEAPQLIEAEEEFKNCLEVIEATYCTLISDGWKAQHAATILPNATKSEIVVTGFVEDWKYLLDLRALGTTGAPHPQMKELMIGVYEEFITRGYIKEHSATSDSADL